MYLIYGYGNDPASHLVEYRPACIDPEREYFVLNGCIFLQEAVRGDRRALRRSSCYPRAEGDDQRVITLTMVWGPTMKPRDAIRNSMRSPGESWDYNTILRVARQLMTVNGEVVTFEERMQRDAADRNPPPQEWDPETWLEAL